MPRGVDPVLSTKISHAFKEWAVVVDALGRGDQILILRKGGVQEESHLFRPEHKEFFLFPTFEHQNEEDLVPSARFRLKEMEIQEAQLGSAIPIQFYALLEASLKIFNIDTLHKLKDHHIWSDQAVDKRFLWGEEKWLNVLLVKVFRLSKIFNLKSRKSYAGCKSWVDFEEVIPMEGSNPVLEEKEFKKRLDAIKKLLK